MPLLLNRDNPYYRIYNPANDSITAFVGGKLVIEEDDENYACVMAEASRNPSIEVWSNSATCSICGETVGKGSTAAASLASHMNKAHPNATAEALVSNVEVKGRATNICDVCRPAQVFDNERGLIDHIALIHAAAPVVSDTGEVSDSTPTRRRRPGEVAPIPAAKVK